MPFDEAEEYEVYRRRPLRSSEIVQTTNSRVFVTSSGELFAARTTHDSTHRSKNHLASPDHRGIRWAPQRVEIDRFGFRR
jgi:hypothetical protein